MNFGLAAAYGMLVLAALCMGIAHHLSRRHNK